MSLAFLDPPRSRFGVKHEKRIHKLRDKMRVIKKRLKADDKHLLKRDQFRPDMRIIRSVQTKSLKSRFPLLRPDCSLITLVFVIG